MRIIKIEPYENGGHDNQTINGIIPVPDSWAVIPDDMETPNFPFGNLTVDEQVPPVVTSWEPLPIPDPEPVEPETEDVTWEAMAAAITEGVNDV